MTGFPAAGTTLEGNVLVLLGNKSDDCTVAGRVVVVALAMLGIIPGTRGVGVLVLLAKGMFVTGVTNAGCCCCKKKLLFGCCGCGVGKNGSIDVGTEGLAGGTEKISANKSASDFAVLVVVDDAAGFVLVVPFG